MVGANAGAASGGARVAQLRCGARKGTEWIALEASRPSEEKSSARTTRIAGMNDACTRSPATSSGMGVGGVTVPSRGSSVHSFK